MLPMAEWPKVDQSKTQIPMIEKNVPPKETRGLYIKVVLFMLFGAAAVTFGKEFKYLQGEIGNTNSYTKIVNQGGEGQGGGLRIPTSPIEQNPDIAAADNEEDGGGGDGEDGEGLKIAMLTVSANKMLDDPSKRYGEEKAIVTSPMSIDNKVRYCLHQGWDLVIGGVLGDHVPKEDVRGRQMEERSSRWLKIYHILRIFDNYDIIVWMDLDTLMTTSDINMVEYFDGDKDLHLTDDWGNWKRINSGVFGFRTTDWTRKFFEDVWMHNDGGKGVSDQRSINHVLEHRSEEERQAKVDILDRSIFNAFPRILEGENKYIVVGMVLPEVNVNLDGDANENSLVIHFAGAFAGCCNNSNRIPDGMLIQYVAMVRGHFSAVTVPPLFPALKLSQLSASPFPAVPHPVPPQPS
jgi:hypothetical protein